jgi:hypothetical protein
VPQGMCRNTCVQALYRQQQPEPLWRLETEGGRIDTVDCGGGGRGGGGAGSTLGAWVMTQKANPS